MLTPPPHPRCQKPEPMVPGHLTGPLVYQKFNLDQCRNSPRRHRHYVNIIHRKLMFLCSTVLCCPLAQIFYKVRHDSCISYTIEAASQLKMGKGGVHNPVSCNILCSNHKLPHITFSRELHHQGVAQPFTVP